MFEQYDISTIENVRDFLLTQNWEDNIFFKMTIIACDISKNKQINQYNISLFNLNLIKKL